MKTIQAQAEFIISNTDTTKCPKPDRPEYAFIGRSNVGKSSLINCLFNKKNLAKTSGKPGKTQLINHFLVNKEWYLVDLPGYGYASVPKKEKEKWEKMIRKYILTRENLVNMYVLIDIRHKAQQIDQEFMEWLGTSGIPFTILFTKADKLTKAAIEKQAEVYCETMLEKWEEMPPWIITSANTGKGSEKVLEQMVEYNSTFKK
jgi:GTP-binding protein